MPEMGDIVVVAVIFVFSRHGVNLVKIISSAPSQDHRDVVMDTTAHHARRLTLLSCVLSYLQYALGMSHCFFANQGPSWLPSGAIAIAITITASLALFTSPLFIGDGVVKHRIRTYMYCVSVSVIVSWPSYFVYETYPSLQLAFLAMFATITFIVVTFTISIYICCEGREKLMQNLSSKRLSAITITITISMLTTTAILTLVSVSYQFSPSCVACPHCDDVPGITITESGRCIAEHRDLCRCYTTNAIDGVHFGCAGDGEGDGDGDGDCYYLIGSWVRLMSLLSAISALLNVAVLLILQRVPAQKRAVH